MSAEAGIREPVTTDERGGDRPSRVHQGRVIPWAGVFHLLVIYIIWGAIYLAMRLGVREGAGFPPFGMGAMRFLVAGVLLLLLAAGMRTRLRLSKRELVFLIVSGLLLWLGGNGGALWAMQRVDSGYTALLLAVMPIWVALMESCLDRRMPSVLLGLSLLVGLGGVGLLSMPVLLSGARADLLGVLGILIAGLTWSAGSVLQSRTAVGLAPHVSSGYQQIFGGLGFALIWLMVGEPLPSPTPEAWAAWGYLVVFASILGFTSFVLVLRLLPTSIVMTYAYVNPVIAVLLGWLVLGESITAWTIGGAVLVMSGVAGAFRERFRQREESSRAPA